MSRDNWINFKGKGKKGLLASPIIDMWSLIVLVLIAVIFVILLNITKHNITEEINAESGKIMAQSYFMNFLRAPVDLGSGEYKSPVEIVLLAFPDTGKNRNYRNVLEMEAKRVFSDEDFSQLPEDTCYARIGVTYGRKGEVTHTAYRLAEAKNPEVSCSGIYLSYHSSFNVPTAIGNGHDYFIVLELWGKEKAARIK